MICMGIMGRISRRIFDQQAGCQRSFHLFHPAIIPPTPLQPVLIVCIKEAVRWIWSKIHRCGFVLHLIRVSISLGPAAFFILNQYLLQSVPAILQNGHWCRRISRKGLTDMEWSLGRRAYVGQRSPLFLLKLDGVSWTAGQGRGVEGCWWMDLLFTFSFTVLCMYAHMIGKALSELERSLVYLS